MNAASEFDLGPLTWVKGEIDSALDRAAEALAQFRDSQDSTKIRFCRNHVHQVHGALAIVGLDGVTQVTDTLESLLLAVEEGRLAAGPAELGAVDKALPAIRQYLDDLMAGEANQPLRLLPVYREINEARGVDKHRASDLFFPDLSVRPPKRAEPVVKLAPEEFRQCLKTERMRFQKGLLAWLKSPPGSPAAMTGLDSMRTALKTIESTQETPAARAFWWISQGFLDSLADQGVAVEQDAKQLCARIDMQIRRLLEGSRNVAERLMRDALYFVGRAPAVETGLASEVRKTFHIDSLIPKEAAAPTTAPQEAALRRLRELIVATEELWNKFCAGNATALAGFAEQARNCGQVTASIAQTDLKRLGQSLAATAAWLAEDPSRQSETVAMEVATAILLLQNAQENFKRLGVEFARQVDLMVARLQACITGKSVAGVEEVPLLDEMTRRAQEKLLITQVAREIQSNLGQVEQALDTFFRDPSGGFDAVALDAPIRQISGALAMLGHDTALAALQECSQQIKRFGEKTYRPVDADFEAVAQQLSSLGFFVDSLQTGASDYDIFVRKLRGEEIPGVVEEEEVAAEEIEVIAPVPTVTVEEELEQKKGDTQALLEALKEAPQDEQLKKELKQNLQALQADADLVADHALGETAKAALNALQAGGDVAPELDAALSSLKTAAPEAPSPSEETLKLAQSSHEEIDAELLEIFLEEAGEVLGNLETELDKIVGYPGDVDALTNIRRAAHTLKGSGRMVGLKDLGEVAWEIEQTLNMWLRQEMAVTPALIELIDMMQNVFGVWVQELSANTGRAPDASELVATACKLRGAAVPEPIPAPAAPAPAPVSTPEPAPAAQPLSSVPAALAEEEMPAALAATVVGIGAMFGTEEPPEPSPAAEPAMDFEFTLDLPAKTEPVPLGTLEPEPEVLNAAEVPAALMETVVAGLPVFEEPAFAATPEPASGDFDFALDLEMPSSAAVEEMPEPPAQEPAEAVEVRPEVEAVPEAVAEPLVINIDLPAPTEAQPAPAEHVEIAAAPLPQVNDITAPSADEEFSFEFDLGEPESQSEAAATLSLDDMISDLPAASAVEETIARPEQSEVFEISAMPAEEAVGGDFDFDMDLEAPVSGKAETVDSGEDGKPIAPAVQPQAAVEELPVQADTEVVQLEPAPVPGDVSAVVETEAPAIESVVADTTVPVAASVVGEALADEPVEPMQFGDIIVVEPEPEPQPEPAAEQAPPAEAESSVSSALYEIFLEEARGHLDTLAASYTELEHAPATPTTFAMTRAAHTLGGIAATVGLLSINRLAIGLEHALLRRDNSAHPESIEGLEIVRQTIMALEDMFAGLARNREPEPQAVLLDSLEEIFPLAAPREPDVAVVTVAEIQDAPPTAATIEAQVETVTEVANRLQEMPQLQDELDEQLLPIFLEEAQDLVQGFSEQVQAWRQNPEHATEPARALARLLHTFKGGARMAGAMNLGEMTHTLEAGLEEALRSGALSRPLLEQIESGCDTLTQIVERLLAGESPTLPMPVVTVPGEIPAALLPEAAAMEGIPAGEAAPVPVAAPVQSVAAVPAQESEAGQKALLRVRADLVDRLVNEAGELSIARARIEGEMLSLKGSLLDLTENVIRLRRQLREIEIQAEGQIQARVAQTNEGEAQFDPLELDRFTRFQELTRFMAESVNDVATVQQNLLKNLDDANAAIIAQARMNRALQQDLMGIRMEPFANQGQRLYRIARQTAKELGRRVDLDIRGGHVEIDRSVQDKIMAPIEHMLRNAISHGIEDRADRQAAGKPETGEVTLTLSQEGNEIVVAMTDDGRGLDREAIRTKAILQGLLAPDEVVDDSRLFDFIFHAGFSTASQVTQISGRGVGMDVVKSEITSLGGRIEIVSARGKGTTFRLYLPLTLAVTQTLLVRAAGVLYAIPSTMIEQVLELKDTGLAEIRTRGEALWMGNRYPFSFLPHLLGDANALPETRRRYWVLLLRSGQQRVSILVDELAGNREVVVKNIGAQLSRVVGIAGATVLGDGRVVLILNPVALATRQAQVVVQMPAAPQAGEEAVAPAAPSARTGTLPTVMVVDDSLTVRKITGRLLAREGYQVITAKDGVDALEHLVETIPDVMLSDIEMPRMDGFDLVRNVRADERLKNLPVIMITSRTADKHRNYALEIGANEYLGKPYDEDKLLGLIAGFIKQK